MADKLNHGLPVSNQRVIRMDLEPWFSGSQEKRPNHWATLSLWSSVCHLMILVGGPTRRSLAVETIGFFCPSGWVYSIIE